MSTIKASQNNIFKRIHDGELFGQEIVLGLDFSTGIERQDLPEYYEERRNPELATPPTLYPYAVEIIEEYRWVFPEDMFILDKFIIPLDTYQTTKVVNLAYFEWLEFRAELDKKDSDGNFVYATLKRSLMPLWDYVALQVTNGNIIVL
jgi:hypothetical protein